MYKIMAFVKSKDGISEEEFIDYYENHHSKLIVELFPWISEYKRSYIPFDPYISIGPRGGLPFDAVTEMAFDDREGLEKLLEKFENPEVSKAIADDEENFMDRDKTVFISL